MKTEQLQIEELKTGFEIYCLSCMKSLARNGQFSFDWYTTTIRDLSDMYEHGVLDDEEYYTLKLAITIAIHKFIISFKYESDLK